MTHAFDNDELEELGSEIRTIALSTNADEYHISAGPKCETAVSVTLRYETTTAKDKIEEHKESES